MKNLFWFICAIIFVCATFASYQPSQAQDGTPVPDPVRDQLNNLGVNTNPTPRRDANNNELPDDYSPLGRTYAPAVTDELAIVGLPFPDRAENIFILDDMNGGGGILHSVTDASLPDSTTFSRDIAQQARDAVGADVDGDGYEELVIVYMRGSEVVLQITDDAGAGFVVSETVVTVQNDILNVRVAAADVSGDAKDEIIIGMSGLGRAVVVIADEVDGRFGVSNNAQFEFSATSPIHPMLLDLDGGNLDYDGAEEWAVVVNEVIPGQSQPDSGLSQYTIYDDTAHNYGVLRTNLVQAVLGGIQNAVTAGVSLGDIDGDGLDEIVLGGLVEHGRCISYGHLLITLDDSINNFADMGSVLNN